MALEDSAIGLSATYAAQATQVAAIRRDVGHYASARGADADTLERIGLAVSEAATNAVLHAYRRDGMNGGIHVTAGEGGGVLAVCVRDEGCGMSPRPDSPGLGLGLCLMAHESDHFEIAAGEDGGTAIFLRFALKAGVDPAARHAARAVAAGARA